MEITTWIFTLRVIEKTHWRPFDILEFRNVNALCQQMHALSDSTTQGDQGKQGSALSAIYHFCDFSQVTQLSSIK